MKKLNVFVVALTLLASASLNSGCSTAKQPDMSRAPELFYTQARDHQVLRLSGVKELHIVGEDITLEVRAQLPPLSMWPKDPNIQEAIVREGAGVLKAVTLGYFGSQIVKYVMTPPKTVDPLVVPQQVLVPVEGAILPTP